MIKLRRSGSATPSSVRNCSTVNVRLISDGRERTVLFARILCYERVAPITTAWRHRPRPYIAPHTLRLGPDGLIYVTCESSAVVAVIKRTTHTVIDVIDSGQRTATAWSYRPTAGGSTRRM